VLISLKSPLRFRISEQKSEHISHSFIYATCSAHLIQINMIILITFGDQVLTMKSLVTCSGYLFCCRRKRTPSSEISRALFIQALNCCDSSDPREAPQYRTSMEQCGSKDGFVTTQTYCCLERERGRFSSVVSSAVCCKEGRRWSIW
jgi:hypothetical protein